jgi:hypothetical protein
LDVQLSRKGNFVLKGCILLIALHMEERDQDGVSKLPALFPNGVGVCYQEKPDDFWK